MKTVIKDYYNDLNVFYKDDQNELLMKKMLERTSDVNALAQNTLLYAPVEELKKRQGESSQAKKSGEDDNSPSPKGESAFKYSAFDLRLTALLFNFYFLTALTDVMALQTDSEILSLPLQKEEEAEEESFGTKAYAADILAGNQAGLGNKIADILVSFINFIAQDKKKTPWTSLYVLKNRHARD